MHLLFHRGVQCGKHPLKILRVPVWVRYIEMGVLIPVFLDPSKCRDWGGEEGL